jgi:hypothetical protein
LWIASTVTAAIVMPKNKKSTKKETDKIANHRKAAREEPPTIWVHARPAWSGQ